MKSVKIYYILRVTLASLLGIGAGVGILLANSYAEDFFDVFLIFIGVVSILFNVPNFLLSLRAMMSKKRWEWISMLVSGLGIVVGGVFLVLPRDASILLPILLIAYAVLLPMLRVVLVEERLKQAMRESPKLVVAAVLFVVSAFELENTLFRVCGIALIAFSGLYLLLRLLLLRPYIEMLEEQIAASSPKSEK